MRCSVGLVSTDVSEERVASIVKVEKSASEQPTANTVPHSQIFRPEDGGDMFLRNVGTHKT
jgi:hypothetical protein